MTLPKPGSKGNLYSILCMIAAVGIFSLMDAILKTLTAFYPPMQVAALRGLAAMPLVCVYVIWRGNVHTLLHIRWPLHLLRGALSVAMLYLFSIAVNQLPLTDAYTIFFVSPLLITALSVPLLKEKVKPHHWIAIVTGFGGVLIAMRPSGDGFLSWGALAVLGAALGYAVTAIAARVLSRTDTPDQVVFWTTLFMSVGASALAAPSWTAINPAHGWLIACLGLFGFLGLITITEAFQNAQASVVAPLEYTALAWGMGLDYFIWHTTPDAVTLLGGAIIIASGIYLIRGEQVREATLAP